jgi:hypothetical protein
MEAASMRSATTDAASITLYSGRPRLLAQAGQSPYPPRASRTKVAIRICSALLFWCG